MIINCVWEHNGNDTLLYSTDYIGAYTRGESLEIAKAKMPKEIVSYCKWLGKDTDEEPETVIVGEKRSELAIRDADSDVLFESEQAPLNIKEYEALKNLALKSAKDFLALYESIPDKNAAAALQRQTFYGQAPRTANEMYEHTKNVNTYYFGEIGVVADNDGNIYECRKLGFEALEKQPDFLQNAVIEGSYGEAWSLRKVLRRFIWHDRIHAKAMYRMAVKLFGVENVADTFYFRLEKDMITYEKAEICDIERIYCLCKQLIDDYENIDRIDYEKVMKWVRRKIESSIDEYTAVYVSGEKAGYYHFYQNEDGEYEIDDLYIFLEYQNRGIGTEIIKKCCSSVNAPVMLYVFVKNEKAVALYQRLGFKVIRTVNDSRYVMRREG